VAIAVLPKILGRSAARILTNGRPTYGTTSLVAASALSRADNLQKLAATRRKWLSRVPATLQEAQAALAQAAPATMGPVLEGSRYPPLTADDGGGEQRWRRVDSEQRRAHAQRTVDKQGLKQSAKERTAFQKLCRTTCACAADAQHALADCAQGLEATQLHQTAIQPSGRDAKRGRPRPATPLERVVSQMQGALASALATREARLTPQSCFILATTERDAHQLPPQELRDGYKGHSPAERGFRFRKAPRFLASSLSRKKPARIMALRMVMTVCLLVYAAGEERMRTALTEHGATFPDQKGQPTQPPTARWVLQYFVGIHLLRMPGEGAMILHLNDAHRKLLRFLGKSSMWLYGVEYS
jgi:transposase